MYLKINEAEKEDKREEIVKEYISNIYGKLAENIKSQKREEVIQAYINDIYEKISIDENEDTYSVDS